MRILITGGSGFIGTHAVQYFAAKGWNVLNIDLVAPKIPAQKSFWVQGDIREADKLRNIVAEFRPDYVLNLAATTGAEENEVEEGFFDTNTRGVENLISAIRAVGTVKRTIYVSSLLVCRNGYIPTGDEDYCPPAPYGASKVEGEKIVRRHASGAGEWTIVRPTGVWGPWFDYSYRMFFRLIAKGFYFHISGAADLIKPTSYVGNAVYMLDKILTANANMVSSRTFYLADYPESTVRNWADTIRTQLGARKIVTLPLWLLRVAAGVGDTLKLVGWANPPLTSFRLNNILTGGQYPLEPTRDVVGRLPFTQEEGVRETIHWMKESDLL